MMGIGFGESPNGRKFRLLWYFSQICIYRYVKHTGVPYIYIYIYRLFCCYSPKKIVSWPLPKWGSPQSASHCCRGGCLKLLTSAEGRVKHPSSTTVLQPFAAKKFSAHVLRRATRNQSWAWAPLVSRKATTQGLWNLRLWGSILSLLLTGSRSRNSTPGSKGLEQTAVGSLWGWLRIWLRRWFRMTGLA